MVNVQGNHAQPWPAATRKIVGPAPSFRFTEIFWLVVGNIHILGMSSSQLTFIFFRGVETTNQIIIDPVEWVAAENVYQ
jgi:hypothetical protein